MNGTGSACLAFRLMCNRVETLEVSPQTRFLLNPMLFISKQSCRSRGPWPTDLKLFNFNFSRSRLLLSQKSLRSTGREEAKVHFAPALSVSYFGVIWLLESAQGQKGTGGWWVELGPGML